MSKLMSDDEMLNELREMFKDETVEALKEQKASMMPND